MDQDHIIDAYGSHIIDAYGRPYQQMDQDHIIDAFSSQLQKIWHWIH